MTSTTGSPGRPRLFDEEEALDRITDLFWEQGYGKTTMAEVVEASGVHKPSLYRTFGTKEELFATVLRRYVNARMSGLGELIGSTGPGVDGIHEFLDMLRRELIEGVGRRGCLLVATSTELCGTTPGFENFGPIYRDELRALLRPLVARAGGSDEVVDQRARVLATWMQGLDVGTRGAASVDETTATIDAMQAIVDTWR